LALLHTVQKYGGNFSLLWHNTSFWGRWRPYVWVYEEMLHQISSIGEAACYQHATDLQKR